jgi:hypothetical protein
MVDNALTSRIDLPVEGTVERLQRRRVPYSGKRVSQAQSSPNAAKHVLRLVDKPGPYDPRG